MALIPYLEDGDPISADSWNTLFEEFDRKLSEVFDNHSILFWSESDTTGPSSQTFESFVGRCFYFYNSNAFFINQIFSATDTEPNFKLRNYNHQTFVDAAANTAVAGSTAAEVDHTRRIVKIQQPAEAYYTAAGLSLSGPALFEFSLAAMTKEHRASVSDPLVPYKIVCPGPAVDLGAGGTDPVLEHTHRYGHAELIFDGHTDFDFLPAWNKYNFFRIHNLYKETLTVNFKGVNGQIYHVVTVPAYGSKCVRRDSVTTGYVNGWNHMHRMASGDWRLYSGLMNGAPETVGLDSGKIRFNNVINPQIIFGIINSLNVSSNTKPRVVLDLERFWDASGIYCNPNYSSSSKWVTNPPVEGRGYFGSLADSTIVGDLLHHVGKVIKVTTTGGTEAHTEIMFKGYGSIVADFLAAGVTVSRETGWSGTGLNGNLLTITASGTTDLVTLSTNIVTGSDWYPNGTIDFTEDTFPSDPVMPIGTKMFQRMADRFRARAVTNKSATSNVTQRNLDGSSKPPVPFTYQYNGNSDTTKEVRIHETTIGDIRNYVVSLASVNVTFDFDYRFTGFGFLMFWTRTATPTGGGNGAGDSAFATTYHAGNGVDFSGASIIETGYWDYPISGWPSWRQTTGNQDGSELGGYSFPGTLAGAFTSPRVCLLCSKKRHYRSSRTIFRQTGVDYYANPDFKDPTEVDVDDYEATSIKVQKKTGVAFLGRFTKENIFRSISAWANGTATMPGYPSPPGITVSTTVFPHALNSPSWYPSQRQRLIDNTPDADRWLLSQRWMEFDRLPLIVDHYNNIASVVNAIVKVRPLHFHAFYSNIFATNGGFSGTIRPINQAASGVSASVCAKLGLPRKVLADLPASFQTLLTKKRRTARRGPVSGVNRWIIEEKTSNLFTPPSEHNWVTISDLKACAARLGFKFHWEQAVIPLKLMIVEPLGEPATLFSGNDVTVSEKEFRFYDFVETSDLTEAEYCKSIDVYRLREDYAPADILTIVGDSETMWEITSPDSFRKRLWPTSTVVSTHQTKAQPLHEQDRNHLAFYYQNESTLDTSSKAIKIPAPYLTWGDEVHWSRKSKAHANARFAFGLNVIPATFNAASGAATGLSLEETQVLTASSGACDVSILFDNLKAV